MRNLLWPRQLPDTATLVEFQRAYAFLKAQPVPGLSDEQERQRYMFGYSMFVFTRSVLVTVMASLIAVIACFALAERLGVDTTIGNLLGVWLPNALLENRVLAHTAVDPSSNAAARAITRVLCATTVAHLVWIGWLVWRGAVEMRRTEYAVDRPNRTYIDVVIAAITWGYLLLTPINDQSIYAPAFDDAPSVLAIKEAIVISAAYALTGIAAMYVTTQVRRARRRNRGAIG